MNDLITQSYWLLFDYIKPCLIPYPNVKYEPIMSNTVSDFYKVFNIIRNYDMSITFHAYNLTNTNSKKIGIYQVLIELLRDYRTLSSITGIFKDSDGYEIALTVVKNMILAGRLTKDECIKVFSEAECYEALVELLQFDAGEDSERFDL